MAKDFTINGQNTQAAHMVQPKLSDGKLQICDKCKSPRFEEQFLLIKISKLLTGQSKDALTPIPVIVCASCGEIYKDSLPTDVQTMLNKDN